MFLKHVFQPRFWIFLPSLRLSHLCRVLTGIAAHRVPGPCIPPARGLRAHPRRVTAAQALPAKSELKCHRGNKARKAIICYNYLLAAFITL